MKVAANCWGRLPHNINDPEFAQTLADQFNEITAQPISSALRK